MKQKTIKLQQPVEWAGQTYTQLTLRKLKVKHMLEINLSPDSIKNPIEQYAALIAASSGVDVGVIHELDMDDFNVIQDALENFSNQASTDSTQSTQGR